MFSVLPVLLWIFAGSAGSVLHGPTAAAGCGHGADATEPESVQHLHNGGKDTERAPPVYRHNEEQHVRWWFVSAAAPTVLFAATRVCTHKIIFSKCSEREEEPLKMQINDMQQKISKEKVRGARLKQKVQILGSLNTAEQVWTQNGDE